MISKVTHFYYNRHFHWYYTRKEICKFEATEGYFFRFDSEHKQSDDLSSICGDSSRLTNKSKLFYNVTPINQIGNVISL